MRAPGAQHAKLPPADPGAPLEACRAGTDARIEAQAALAVAAEAGHLAAVCELLDAGEQVDCGPALRAAVRGGHLAVVDALIAAGADVHAESGLSLRLAASGGHAGVVRSLLRAGADVHAVEDASLVDAAESGHVEVVGMLVAAGADVRARNGGALRGAMRQGHAAVVSRLLHAGAVLTAQLVHQVVNSLGPAPAARLLEVVVRDERYVEPAVFAYIMKGIMASTDPELAPLREHLALRQGMGSAALTSGLEMP